MKSPIFSFALLVTLLAAVPALAGEVTYREHIKPIVDARCLSCHGPGSLEYKAFKLDKESWVAKGLGPRMDSYTYLVYYTGWPDTGALMRRLDDAKPGNMYRYLGDDEEQRQQNLALFKAWVGGWTLKRFKDLTRDELAAIEVPY